MRPRGRNKSFMQVGRHREAASKKPSRNDGKYKQNKEAPGKKNETIKFRQNQNQTAAP
jgi:hypothetical protein